MKSHIYILLASTIFFCLACSGTDPAKPAGETVRIRLINIVYDDTSGLDVRVNENKVISNTRANSSSGYVIAGATGESVKVSVHYTGIEASRVSSLQRMYEGSDYTVYAFPPARTLSASFSHDERSTVAGRARIKIVNGCSDAQSLALGITDARNPLVGPVKYTEVSGYTNINPGMYSFSVTQPSDPSFEIAFDSIHMNVNSAYTVVLTGTLSDADSWGFVARVYDDNGDGISYRDLSVLPDRGRFKIVHAIPNAPVISAFIDGSTTARFINVGFGVATPYVELPTGPHTANITVNGSSIISAAPFSTSKRGKTTMFITGTIVPPNVAAMEFADLKVPISDLEASVRFLNLSPDAPALDGYFVTSMGEQKINGFQNVTFRGSSTNPFVGGQFLNVFPGTYVIVCKKAGTDEVVVPPATFRFEAGQIQTLWVGGNITSASMNLVRHY